MTRSCAQAIGSMAYIHCLPGMFETITCSYVFHQLFASNSRDAAPSVVYPVKITCR
jgi:hypothetical protein